ncbi:MULTISPECIES: KinB sensor domain-containing domain [unclassified Pseudomonas]|uniref:KinB sensor domain-containing domain n=1 Tax=unclassified Pseudomonas TaxID=196821 RepID=UPI00244BCB1C|nr:KinB sensor domain-containing domain [Pseudomonas sp. GD03944]MDH1265745.1 ATP-binding protein [Pseudomonas sp. GD03944]
MKLRNQLFLSGSALLTVALIGLLLGMFSVLLLTKSQSEAMERNLQIIDATIGLRQELGRQVILMLGENLDKEALQHSDQRFRQWLQEARAGAMNDTDRQAIGEIEQAYALFDDNLQQPVAVRRALLDNDEFASSLEGIRKRLDNVQIRYVEAVKNSQSNARERAWQIVGLLAFIGLAVLFIGFITAHSIAQRFAHPIEALASAADQIGKGDFQVTLPLSPVAELAALSRRFGLMAEALRQFKNTNVQALMAEQQRLQAVLDSIDDGLLIFDRTGLLEHVNPVARRQLDWQDDPLGRSPGQVFNSPVLDEQLQQVLHGENLQNVTEELQIEVDSETRLLSYSLTPVTLDDEVLHGAVMVLRDVTEQRAFERVRSEFVLRASHELRTPVTGMHMAFGLLQERLSFAPQARETDLLRTVDEEMHRLVRLINDLLNFSRYQNGLQKLELVPCDLDELLNQTRQRFQAQAEEKEITLSVELHGNLPHLQLDRLQIERVLDNLVGNALRHSYPDGSIRLQARMQDDRVILSVEDTGEGIPYSQQTRVFEPFVQVGRKKGGAGLGLALCKEIVQLHGGRIGVHSKPGQGTQFYLALPV